MWFIASKKVFMKAMFLNGYNVSDLSKEAEVGVSYLSQIINGKKTPSPNLAKKLASILNVEVEDLFVFNGGDEYYDSTTFTK
ncbi:helix-turn-helix domain-containing protein [Staphylococcus agnetis]|uniref:helix-turn-helix transcriptional regulator n=1 Tax=Staphylococcus agnetis TaxID=985762 RepID=UPI00208EBD6C|nr:helix-turn-helix transcriptional regulator [Staphylococcus agnetis]MCO4327580.1 helix-turn-helix domain-containing protein [Staphylococcus agnetis]MCO4369916.1 helix-turn-helix domain-containing protein [Staphylococcus agnetis]